MNTHISATQHDVAIEVGNQSIENENDIVPSHHRTTSEHHPMRLSLSAVTNSDVGRRGRPITRLPLPAD